MYSKGIDMGDPFFKYTDEERRNMTEEEYRALIRESNEYVREKHRRLRESKVKPPKFNTIEELREYYDAIPLEEAINNLNKLFEQ